MLHDCLGKYFAALNILDDNLTQLLMDTLSFGIYSDYLRHNLIHLLNMKVRNFFLNQVTFETNKPSL